MMDEQLEEQASLYVLGALEGEELRAFEAKLAADDELRSHVDELTEAAAQLAYVAPARALPAQLEARILDVIRTTKVPSKASAARGAWLPWAIAACLTVACVLAFADRQQLAKRVATLGTELEESQSRNAEWQSQIAESQSQIATLAAEKTRAEEQVTELKQREADARTQMATLAAARDDAAQKLAQSRDEQAREEKEARQAREEREQLAPPDDRALEDALPNVQVATLSSKMSNAPNANAALVWDGDLQRGVLNTNKVRRTLPTAITSLIVDSRFPDPVSDGVFRVEKSGSTRYVFTPTVRIESAVAFAVSLERKGGVVKAEGPIVLAGR